MKVVLLYFLLLFQTCLTAQTEVLIPKEKPPYDRKEEIIHDGKRYRIHNNYFTMGGGVIESSLRDQSQKTLGVDYQFHIRRQQFQVGGIISGVEFFSNNNTQLHAGYGYRIEKNTSNFSAYVGPTYFTGVAGVSPDPPDFYDGFGLYFSVQAVYKIKYDIGLGLELIGDVSYKQKMIGIKLIAFFSGSYRGLKRNYNKNVRSENSK